MAYLIIIGTDNYVKTVVDEIKQSHLQRNIITIGCVVETEKGLYYKWDCFSENGNNNGAEESVTSLRNALTNQISQFKTLLPNDAVPNVFLLGSCFNKKDVDRLKLTYKSLCEVGGATLNNLYIDLVLIGYNLNCHEDVTKTPDWKELRQFKGIENSGRFVTNILYINNKDYDGAATNVDAKLLSRFLGHWSTMISSGEFNPKQCIQSGHYAIGLAERQYNFEDLVPYFKLAAEERIINQALHSPLDATRVMLDTKYFARIILDEPWISGLIDIRDQWKEYCSYKYDYSKKIEEQPHSLSVQVRKLSSFFNDWLKKFCQQQELKKENLLCLKKTKEEELLALRSLVISSDSTDEDEQEVINNGLTSQIGTKEEELSQIKEQIEQCSKKIKDNTFSDYRNISEDLATGLLTEKQRNCYESDKKCEESLFSYLYEDSFVESITDAVKNLNEGEKTPEFPSEIIDNIGMLCPCPNSQESHISGIESDPVKAEIQREGNYGCFCWVLNLFNKKKQPVDLVTNDTPKQIEEIDLVGQWMPLLTSAIKEYRKINDVLNWWNILGKMIDKLEKRRRDCLREMETFKPPYHPKSISIIDMDKVSYYRNNAPGYLSLVKNLVDEYFNSGIDIHQRKTMPDLIDNLIINHLRNKWNVLRWDGQNPFCKEELSCDDINNIVEDQNFGTHKQSKPFIEYVKLSTIVLDDNILSLFYFNHPNIPKEPNCFRNKNRIGSSPIIPVFTEDFTNSLCEVQVLNISDYIDSIQDFKPQTQAVIHETTIDYKDYVGVIVGEASTTREKALAIYNWLCDNISYDVTYQIRDADTCWRNKCGVCQAFCELFYRLGKAVGLTVDIVSGKSKLQDGKISEKPHSWVFVYTKGYDGILIDPTWGAGSISENGEFIKAIDNSKWFDVQPSWMIYTHFPDDKEWIKLEQLNDVLTEDVFAKLPYVEPSSDNGLKSLNKDLFIIKGFGH